MIEMATKPCELHDVFRRNVIARRKELGLTQQAVADRIGIQRPTYANIERGKAIPGLDIVAKVATALAVEASELLNSGCYSSAAS